MSDGLIIVPVIKGALSGNQTIRGNMALQVTLKGELASPFTIRGQLGLPFGVTIAVFVDSTGNVVADSAGNELETYEIRRQT